MPEERVSFLLRAVSTHTSRCRLNRMNMTTLMTFDSQLWGHFKEDYQRQGKCSWKKYQQSPCRYESFLSHGHCPLWLARWCCTALWYQA
jgi:hypothetical protein